MFSEQTFNITTDLAKYTFTFTSRLNLLKDDSATGKTSLYRAVDNSYNLTNVITYSQFLYNGDLFTETGKLILVDGNDLTRLIRNNLFDKFLDNTPNVVLIISRFLKLRDKVQRKDMYRLVGSNASYHLEHLYAD